MDFSELNRRLDRVQKNFGIAGQIGHALQAYIPVYGIINDYKKNKALSNYGMSDSSAAARTCVNFFLTGLIGYGATGDKFEDLVNIITNATMEQKGFDRMQYDEIRKKVKKILYSNKDPEGLLQGINIQIPYVGQAIR